MKKTTLRVYPTAYMWFIWIAAFLSLLMLLFGDSIFGPPDGPLWETVLASILSLSISAFLIFYALYLIQHAEVSEEGITIYLLGLFTIKAIKWDELVDVRTVCLINVYNVYRGGDGDWIVLYTDQKQKDKWYSMLNRRKAGPWYIACTKENITTLTEYIIKYAPHICDDPDVFL